MSFPRASVLFLSDHYRSQKLINFKKSKKRQTIYGDNSDPEITRYIAEAAASVGM